MFNYVKSIACAFSWLSDFGFVGKLASVVAVFGLQFLGAKNSESCLIEIQCLGEVSASCSVSKLELQLSFLTLRLNANAINFMS